MSKAELNLGNLSTAPFSDQVSILRQLFGFSKSEFAKALSVNEDTITHWEQSGMGKSMPHDPNKQAVDSLRTIAESLDDLFEPDMIKVWIDKSNPALQGERPRDFARKPGGIFLMANLLKNISR